MRHQIIAYCAAIAFAVMSCGSEKQGHNTSEGQSAGSDTVKVTANQRPEFSADSAKKYLKEQVELGPRVPGTPANIKCREYIVDKMTQFGVDTVYIQKFMATTFDGKKIEGGNVFGQLNPEKNTRVLLAAHYDTRTWADNEPTVDKRDTPIDGANDGASGVAVLLELARQFAANNPKVGVDFLFVDIEDHGNSDGWELHNDSWCLGSQYFAANQPYHASNRPVYGIVLDMVGGLDARFHREYFSEKYAPHVVNRVWQTASQLGYGETFINQLGGSLIDDHLPLSKGGIPTIDIVECNNVQTGGFPPTWHTTQDNLSNISATTLKAVGNVVSEVIYTQPLPSSQN